MDLESVDFMAGELAEAAVGDVGALEVADAGDSVGLTGELPECTRFVRSRFSAGRLRVESSSECSYMTGLPRPSVCPIACIGDGGMPRGYAYGLNSGYGAEKAPG
jgi:hypothetical protein